MQYGRRRYGYWGPQRPGAGGGGGVVAASLFANDSQSFWLMRENAVAEGGSIYVTGCSGTTSKCQIEVHELTAGVRKTHWMGDELDNVDDHNNPSLSVLPDGRLMMATCQHTESNGTYYRITTAAPPNIGGWGRQFLAAKNASSLSGVSYHTTIHAENGKTYIFRRENIDGGLNRREQGVAYIDTSALEATDIPTWTSVRMFMRPNARPYALYVKWGPTTNRVFCVASYGHPGEVATDCDMYGFYMDLTAGAPTYWKMNGTQIVAALPFDLKAEATLIKAQGADGKMWPLDVIIGPDGQPWVIFSRHPSVVNGADGRSINAEYWFARWTGSAWVEWQLASNVRTPLLSQGQYTPGACFDKNDPRKIFLSESFGDNIPEIREYSFDETTGVKTEIRQVGNHGNGREKIRMFSPKGASPATRLIYSEAESYTGIGAFEMHQWADALAVTPDGFTGPLDAATTALISRMSVAPNATWERYYDWLVRRLKVGGLNGTDNWTDAGAFYSFIAHDAQAARLDWKGTANATLTGSPTFTAGVGYIGVNTTTDVVNLPASNAIAGFSQNSAHAGIVYNLNAGNSALRRAASSPPILIDNGTLRINETGGLSRSGNNTATTNKRQFTVANRSGATATQYYMDGALMKTGTGASVAVTADALLVGYNNTMTTEAVTLGGSKTLAQIQDLNYALAGFRRLVQSRPAP